MKVEVEERSKIKSVWPTETVSEYSDKSTWIDVNRVEIGTNEVGKYIGIVNESAINKFITK